MYLSVGEVFRKPVTDPQFSLEFVEIAWKSINHTGFEKAQMQGNTDTQGLWTSFEKWNFPVS